MWTLEIEHQRAMRLILGDDFYTAYILAESEGLQLDGTEEHLSYIGSNFKSKKDISNHTLGRYVKEHRSDVMAEIDLVINKMAVDILAKALRYVPVDTGRLRDSAYIKKQGDVVAVGFNCPYAIYVHEVAYNRHKKPTKYKFLEDATYEIKNKYLKKFRLGMIYIDYRFVFNDEGVAVLISRTGKNDKGISSRELKKQYKNYRDNDDFILDLKRELKYQNKLPDSTYKKLLDYVEYYSNRGKGKRASTKDILRSFAERISKGTV